MISLIYYDDLAQAAVPAFNVFVTSQSSYDRKFYVHETELKTLIHLIIGKNKIVMFLLLFDTFISGDATILISEERLKKFIGETPNVIVRSID